MPKKVNKPSKKSRYLSDVGARRLKFDSRLKTSKSAAAERYTQWLCDPKGECEPMLEKLDLFTENPNWRIFRIMAEFIEGFEFLDRFHGEVTIFGSARAKKTDKNFKLARKLGKLLAENDYTVITGGGPGIMEAANWGAFEGGGESVGLDIELPKQQRRNQYVTHAMGFHYFFTRKVMLSASAQAYVYFPGGFGTLDELSEMTTLQQTGKIPPNVPIILMNSTYWKPFLDWVHTALYREHKYIGKEDCAIFRVVDTAEEAVKIIKNTHEREYGSERQRVFKGFKTST